MSIEWLHSLAVVLFGGFLVWTLSVRLHNTSIVDAYWGPMFLMIAAVAFSAGHSNPTRGVLLLGLVSLWALRLGFHLLRRCLSHPEDRRYRDMRARHGANWWWLSLPYVFVLQAGLAWVVSLPIQAAMMSGADQPLSIWDGVASLCCLSGVAIEALADHQLSRFSADPNNSVRVLDTGLFRYSRHPNYFGDALTWWGFGLFGMSVGASWTLIGPLLMTWLLLRVSGVTLLEQTITSRRPGYEEYRRRTSAFFPWPPKMQEGAR